MSRSPREHLGLRISALVDGALGHDARDRALAHVAECAECLRQLETERRLKASIGALPDPTLPAGLYSRLAGIADAAAPGALARTRSTPMRSAILVRRGARLRWSRSTGRRPGAHPVGRSDLRSPGGLRRSDRLRRAGALTGGLLSVTGVALVTAFAVGAPAGERVVPPVAALSAEHVAILERQPLVEPGFGLLQIQPAEDGGVLSGAALSGPALSGAALSGAALSGTGSLLSIPRSAVPRSGAPAPASASPSASASAPGLTPAPLFTAPALVPSLGVTER